MKVDLDTFQEVLKDARESEHGACVGVLLNTWVPRLLKEMQELRECKAMYLGLCK